MHHQPVNRKRFQYDSKLEESQYGECVTLVSRAGLVEHFLDEARRDQFWRIREQFVEVLRDILFARIETEEQPHFLA